MRIIKNNKFCILVFSLCILTISILTMKIINYQSDQREYIYHEIHYSLYQLNAAITDQKYIGWHEPQIIINQLDEVRTNILNTVKLTNYASGILKKDEALLLEEIYKYLKPLPKNDLLELGKWDEEDTKYIESLGDTLSKTGFNLRDLNLYEWKSMVKQWELLKHALSEKFT